MPSDKVTRERNNIQDIKQSYQITVWRLVDRIEHRLYRKSYIKAFPLIKASAELINNLCESFNHKTATIVCAHCGKLVLEHKLPSHTKRAHQNLPIQKTEFPILDDFIPPKNIDILTLKGLVDPDKSIHVHDVDVELMTLKSVIEMVETDLKKAKMPLTPENCFLYLFKKKEFCKRVPKTIKNILLKVLAILPSEAICETFGSIMESYHNRFKNSDLDDSQAQKEIFIRYVGPGVGPNAEELIRSTLRLMNRNFVLSDKAKFGNVSKVLQRQIKEIYDLSVIKVFYQSQV